MKLKRYYEKENFKENCRNAAKVFTFVTGVASLVLLILRLKPEYSVLAVVCQIILHLLSQDNRIN